MSDSDLLSRYVRDGAHDAFRALVDRHVDLVYSVARRHVRDAAAAEDVAQAVFIELARSARRIKPGTPLVAWLHVVSRRTALNTLRGEHRRHARETAAATLDTMNPPPPAWREVEPLLDEAVESLDETDRSAILLRFFENKTLREVGAALGTSDDAAQKRVSRAVDELRAFFVRRGVALTATGLATTLTAHAAQTAPAGLGLSISSAVAASSAVSSTVLAMTSLQKTAAAIALATFGGLGLYEAKLAARQSDELAALRAQTERRAAEVRTLRTARAATDAKLRSIESQIDARLARGANRPAHDPALESQMRSWLGRMDALRDFLARRPELNTPELQLLAPEEWFEIAGGKPLDSEAAMRRVAAELRNRAQGHASAMLSNALRTYLKAHDNILPATLQELAASAPKPIDRAILERFELRHTGNIADVPRDELTNVIGGTTPADPEFDRIPYLGPNGYTAQWAIDVNIRAAIKAYTTARGQRPNTAAELKPFLKWPASEEEVQRRMARLP